MSKKKGGCRWGFKWGQVGSGGLAFLGDGLTQFVGAGFYSRVA